MKNIKLICFDLDGVLVTSKETHYESLNMALSELSEHFVISKDEHVKKYDGLPTMRKLELLHIEKGLPRDHFKRVWMRKQELTSSVIERYVTPNKNICELFHFIKEKNMSIYVCSNSIRHTTKMYILKLGLMEWVDGYITNEDVKLPKPHPEMYMRAMLAVGSAPDETLILEDSFTGLEAAIKSGANVMAVKSPEDVNVDSISCEIDRLNSKTTVPYKEPRMNILLPMAGAGSRFYNAGYKLPKPLIDVNGKPMIQVVVENLCINARYTYVVQKAHYDKYNLKYMLNLITPGCNIVQTEGVTEGAACTTLLAKNYIDCDLPLLIANSDQYVEWNSLNFMYSMKEGRCDGGILTFSDDNPKWSYVRTDYDGHVVDLKEKQVISNMATVGIYYWSSGMDYVKYAEKMIAENKRVNGEFYVAPVYNEAIADGKKIKTYNVDRMWGLGTPEDLAIFLSQKGKNN
ncbi:HAD family hydrolase [bacterium]|nr:HAD family hydrolase [bacterium]